MVLAGWRTLMSALVVLLVVLQDEASRPTESGTSKLHWTILSHCGDGSQHGTPSLDQHVEEQGGREADEDPCLCAVGGR